MKIGNLVQINIGFFSVEGEPLLCEMKRAWGVITEIHGEGEQLMVHFIKDDREFLIKRSDVNGVVNDNGQIMSSTK